MISQQENFPFPASRQIGDQKNELAGENDEDPFGNRPVFNPLSTLSKPMDGKRQNVERLPAAEAKYRAHGHLPTTSFRRKFFPHATRKDWNDWRWQIQNRIHTPDQLQKILRLSAQERLALEMNSSSLPIGVTPYFMSL